MDPATEATGASSRSAHAGAPTAGFGRTRDAGLRVRAAFPDGLQRPVRALDLNADLRLVEVARGGLNGERIFHRLRGHALFTGFRRGAASRENEGSRGQH